MSAVRWAILSTAKINAALLGGARETSAVEVVAVGSRDRERGEAFAAEHGIGRVHGSYDELLADDEVEAVYIPLPNSMHLPWAERALEAGKHVLCEKPLSAHPERVEAAFDVAERSGRLLMEAFMWRFHPQTELVSRAVADGTVGAVRTIRAAFGFSLPDLGNVRWSGELEGGALMDVGCYCVSAARLVAGEPVAVTGQQVTGEVDVRFTGTLRFANDLLAHFDCGVDTADRAEVEVVGSEGTLLLRDPFHSLEPVIEVRAADGSVERVEVERDNPYACELRDFAAAVAGERSPRLGREDAVGQARAIAALYESAASGARVEL